jgi:hypothetical protein
MKKIYIKVENQLFLFRLHIIFRFLNSFSLFQKMETRDFSRLFKNPKKDRKKNRKQKRHLKKVVKKAYFEHKNVSCYDNGVFD